MNLVEVELGSLAAFRGVGLVNVVNASAACWQLGTATSLHMNGVFPVRDARAGHLERALDPPNLLANKPEFIAWSCKLSSRDQAVHTARSQMPLMAQKQMTLHGVQRKTAATKLACKEARKKMRWPPHDGAHEGGFRRHKEF